MFTNEYKKKYRVWTSEYFYPQFWPFWNHTFSIHQIRDYSFLSSRQTLHNNNAQQNVFRWHSPFTGSYWRLMNNIWNAQREFYLILLCTRITMRGHIFLTCHSWLMINWCFYVIDKIVIIWMGFAISDIFKTHIHIYVLKLI